MSLPQTLCTQPIADVAIIGGGLSGLYAAHLLTQQGLRYVLFEARPDTGGRLLSVSVKAMTSEGEGIVTSHGPTDRFDLGATWFWPAMQPQLSALVSSLGLETFAQPAARLLLALPPRLAAESIRFHPALPPEVSRAWLNTPTWMAPHAKYLAVFHEPFWRADGLAGTAQSAVGPMVEVQDASSPGGHAALFGFIGVPAQARVGIDHHDLLSACRAQLVRLFGERAARPVAETLLDWAQAPFTATARDQVASGHVTAPVASVFRSPWEGRVFGAASEWSPEFPGYIAGAVDAAQRAVDALGRALKAESASA